MKKLYLIAVISLIFASATCAQNFVYGMKGSGGGGNATVPVDAFIQPAQAFVDCFSYMLANTSGAAGTEFFFPSKGITSFQPAAMDHSYTSNGSPPDLDLSGNALTVGTVNAVLAWYAQDAGHKGINYNGTIDLSGGTNAAPTGQGLTDKAALITAGWTVTTN